MSHWILLFAAAFNGAAALGQGEYELVAHLKQNNLAQLEKQFWKVADPDSPSYLQHLTVPQLASLIGASDDEIADARNWLVGMGATPSSIHVSHLRDTIAATFGLGSQPNTWLAEGRPASIEFTVRRDVRDEELQAKVDKPASSHLGAGSMSQYSVSNIKAAYGIPNTLVAQDSSTAQMVWGPGTFGYSKMHLLFFKATQCPLLDESKIKFDTENHGEAGGDNYGEGNLDVQMITSFGLGVETIVSNTNTSASTEEGLGFGQALLDFITELSSRKTVPQVLSLSLGSLSAASCDLLCSEAVKMGHTLKECNDYIQQQRQVCMFLSKAQQARINTAFQVLGLRGVSIFGSSGDGGSHFSFGKFQGGAIADDLNKISCKYQMPVFPTSSPYIVSVGGTQWGTSSKDPVTWAGFGGGSGSGFSWMFDMPDHQKMSVANYLSNTTGLPPLTSFNPKGRAFPDISAVGVQGTSQSCPLAAGIFSLIMDARLNAGLPPLGFAAPRIWKMAQAHRGEVFKDITQGNSKTSCDNGFPSVPGWDPNTGWGDPIWSGMMKHMAVDTGLQKPAASTIVV